MCIICTSRVHDGVELRTEGVVYNIAWMGYNILGMNYNYNDINKLGRCPSEKCLDINLLYELDYSLSYYVEISFLIIYSDENLISAPNLLGGNNNNPQVRVISIPPSATEKPKTKKMWQILSKSRRRSAIS